MRGFRNLLVGGIVVFSLIAVGLGLIGGLAPTTMPLCFTPETDGITTVVCPRAERPVGKADPTTSLDPAVEATVTRGDVWVVELLGLLGAALVGAAALRKLGSTSTPYGVHVALAVFKLPTGAVTAVVGLLLMRAGFVPGLSALDSSAQILGWAVVFGIAQQLVTRFGTARPPDSSTPSVAAVPGATGPSRAATTTDLDHPPPGDYAAKASTSSTGRRSERTTADPRATRAG